MKTNFFSYFVLLSAWAFISSCYSYGPTHIPYGEGARPPLPPPPQKVVPAPLSKSEYMQKTYTEIKSTLEEAEVVLIEDSIKVLFPDNIIYQSKDLLPTSDYLPSLEKFAQLLRKYKKTNILITGHTDSKGNANNNRELSKVRAENIKTILVAKSISESRLETWGLGASSPVADNETEDGRKRNRRVEFVVLYDE